MRLKWVNMEDVPYGAEDYVEESMTRWLSRAGLSRASELMFHTIYMTDNPDGPIVIAYGKDGDDENVHMHYVDRAIA